MAARHNGGAAISKNYTSQYGAVNMADLSKDNGGRSRRPEKLYKVEAGNKTPIGGSDWIDKAVTSVKEICCFFLVSVSFCNLLRSYKMLHDLFALECHLGKFFVSMTPHDLLRLPLQHVWLFGSYWQV